MKKLLSFFAIALIGASAFAATTAPDRRSMVSQYVGPAQRLPSAQKDILPPAASVITDKSSIRAETPSAPVPVDKRDTERTACMNNNIGVGNTFVWASKYSNTNNYASMVEDVQNPENNVCFVKVELKSADSKINVSDIAPVYYEMGRTITCGSWADAAMMKSRILSAKKSARTWGTVAGAVGGAGIGVGAMELFGNKLITGKVEGQKDKNLNPAEVLRSRLLVLKKENPDEYDRYAKNIATLKDECKKINDAAPDKLPDVCKANSEYMMLELN